MVTVARMKPPIATPARRNRRPWSATTTAIVTATMNSRSFARSPTKNADDAGYAETNGPIAAEAKTKATSTGPISRSPEWAPPTAGIRQPCRSHLVSAIAMTASESGRR